MFSIYIILSEITIGQSNIFNINLYTSLFYRCIKLCILNGQEPFHIQSTLHKSIRLIYIAILNPTVPPISQSNIEKPIKSGAKDLNTDAEISIELAGSQLPTTKKTDQAVLPTTPSFLPLPPYTLLVTRSDPLSPSVCGPVLLRFSFTSRSYSHRSSWPLFHTLVALKCSSSVGPL
jgi:hypothetical protein